MTKRLRFILITLCLSLWGEILYAGQACSTVFGGEEYEHECLKDIDFKNAPLKQIFRFKLSISDLNSMQLRSASTHEYFMSVPISESEVELVNIKLKNNGAYFTGDNAFEKKANGNVKKYQKTKDIHELLRSLSFKERMILPYWAKLIEANRVEAYLKDINISSGLEKRLLTEMLLDSHPHIIKIIFNSDKIEVSRETGILGISCSNLNLSAERLTELGFKLNKKNAALLIPQMSGCLKSNFLDFLSLNYGPLHELKIHGDQNALEYLFRIEKHKNEIKFTREEFKKYFRLQSILKECNKETIDYIEEEKLAMEMSRGQSVLTLARKSNCFFAMDAFSHKMKTIRSIEGSLRPFRWESLDAQTRWCYDPLNTRKFTYRGINKDRLGEMRLLATTSIADYETYQQERDKYYRLSQLNFNDLKQETVLNYFERYACEFDALDLSKLRTGFLYEKIKKLESEYAENIDSLKSQVSKYEQAYQIEVEKFAELRNEFVKFSEENHIAFGDANSNKITHFGFDESGLKTKKVKYTWAKFRSIANTISHKEKFYPLCGTFLMFDRPIFQDRMDELESKYTNIIEVENGYLAQDIDGSLFLLNQNYERVSSAYLDLGYDHNDVKVLNDIALVYSNKTNEFYRYKFNVENGVLFRFDIIPFGIRTGSGSKNFYDLSSSGILLFACSGNCGVFNIRAEGTFKLADLKDEVESISRIGRDGRKFLIVYSNRDKSEEEVVEPQMLSIGKFSSIKFTSFEFYDRFFASRERVKHLDRRKSEFVRRFGNTNYFKTKSEVVFYNPYRGFQLNSEDTGEVLGFFEYTKNDLRLGY